MAQKKSRKNFQAIDKRLERDHTKAMLQMSGNSLLDLGRGDAAILDHIDLPGEDARRLMELGFLPGTPITAGLSAPGGDPCVFQVDGSEVALRRDTARKLKIR